MVIFVADAFVEHYVGGAELTTEAIASKCLLPMAKVQSHQLTVETLRANKDSFFIFGNIQNLSTDCIIYAVKNLNYAVLEYDYKFCKYRSPGKHIESEGQCDCHQSRNGKLISLFYNSAKELFWMSTKQAEAYRDRFPFLRGKVLSSAFSDKTLDYIQSLDTSNKDDNWIILNSNSWIKGVDESIALAEAEGLKYELVWGLPHHDLLKKLAKSKGLIFLPKAGDTCPRLVIEAKMLGCELILNDNVQHKDEDWFKTKDSCLELLRKNKYDFWSDIEKSIEYLPDTEESSEQRYIIVTPFYNAEMYLNHCIASLKRQKHQNFKCILIDDMSTDNSAEVAKRMIEGDSRFVLIESQEKNYALKNIFNSLSMEGLEDEDVVVLLDGDDWLSSSSALNQLNLLYGDDCLATYGSYVIFPFGVIGPEPSEYPNHIIENNLYREDKWRASHLRTFKYHLWRQISEDDLKDDAGDFYDVAYDQAIMLPILEMAGDRARYCDKVMHVYNKHNPLNVDKVKTQKQVGTAADIRRKKSYTRIGQ